MGFQEKELEKEGKYTEKLKKKKRTDKGSLLTLDLKPFRSKVKEKHLTRKEFRNLAEPGKKPLT